MSKLTDLNRGLSALYLEAPEPVVAGLSKLVAAVVDEYADALKTAQSEITRLKTQQEWRPIEDAPKDNSSVLILTGKRIDIGSWWDADPEDGGSSAGWIEDTEGRPMQPDHWQLLPALPQATP